MLEHLEDARRWNHAAAVRYLRHLQYHGCVYAFFERSAPLWRLASIAIAAVIVAGCAGPQSNPALRRESHAVDLDGRPIDPFASDGAATVLLFITAQCPISNRYAPEVNRLHAAHGSQGIDFWLVYPNAGDTPAMIRAHVEDYGYTCGVIRDPRHVLVDRTGVAITPEAAVYADDVMIYRGRIDNRYVDFGVSRPAPTERDLEDVLAAIRAGRAVEPRTTTAVGCFIMEPP